MVVTRLEDWIRWSSMGYNRVPVIASYPHEQLPATWSDAAKDRTLAVLESGGAGARTYVCDRANCVIIGTKRAAEIWDGRCINKLRRIEGPPIAVLQQLLNAITPPPAPCGLPMTGGLIGAFAYDAVQTWEKLPLIATRDPGLPAYVFIEPDELFIYDHVQHELSIVAWSNLGNAFSGDISQRYHKMVKNLADAYSRWIRWQHSVRCELPQEVPRSNGQFFLPARDKYISMVASAKQLIASGDTYQVNLSLRADFHFQSRNYIALYETLRAVNPSPYMGLFRLPWLTLVSCSPELLVRLMRGHAVSRPIAGTRPTDPKKEIEARFRADLTASAKEKAEHLMLVDLVRNDLGRIAEFGSVHVREFMAVERYSHVMHLVSEIEAKVCPPNTWADLFRSMFPGGTVTGCPKIRTMEIIEALEPVPRGFYTGSLGWISYAGDMEMNIIIRSILLLGGRAYVQAGSGIVADSDPEQEFLETCRKAEALVLALEKVGARPVEKDEALTYYKR